MRNRREFVTTAAGELNTLANNFIQLQLSTPAEPSQFFLSLGCGLFVLCKLGHTP
jgi:hypothetical protein